MRAFYKTDNLLIKAYDMGDDWKMVTGDNNERWFSKWQKNEYASLHRAFFDMVTMRELPFKESNIVLCGQ